MSLTKTQEVLNAFAFSVCTNTLPQRQLYSVLEQPALFAGGIGRFLTRSGVDGTNTTIALNLEGLCSHILTVPAQASFIVEALWIFIGVAS